MKIFSTALFLMSIAYIYALGSEARNNAAFMHVHSWRICPKRCSRLEQHSKLTPTCKADRGPELKTNWEFARFASTFTYFNGNPLGRIFPFLASKVSVPRPIPQNINSKEIVLWDFASLSQAKLSRCFLSSYLS